jgi:Zn-dependent peptidase ImmA (M78 family)
MTREQKARFSVAAKSAHALIGKAKINAAPVPVLALARDVAGVVVRFEPFAGDVSGMFFRSPGETPIIGVNSLESPERQRFTIAHELGHLFLHEDEAVHVDKRFTLAFRDGRAKTAEDVREIEANHFAAELLVPHAFLVRDLREHRVDIESDDEVAALARKYEVSAQMMTIRLSKVLSL